MKRKSKAAANKEKNMEKGQLEEGIPENPNKDEDSHISKNGNTQLLFFFKADTILFCRNLSG